MCVDSANCGGYCSECQHDTIKRLRARVQELKREYDQMYTAAQDEAIARREAEARVAELEAAMMEYGMHAYDENGEPCYGDQLTRCVDEDGNAEKYACTCGFSAALAGKRLQEGK